MPRAVTPQNVCRYNADVRFKVENDEHEGKWGITPYRVSISLVLLLFWVNVIQCSGTNDLKREIVKLRAESNAFRASAHIDLK